MTAERTGNLCLTLGGNLDSFLQTFVWFQLRHFSTTPNRAA